MESKEKKLICPECGSDDTHTWIDQVERHGCANEECMPDEVDFRFFECLHCGFEDEDEV